MISEALFTKHGWRSDDHRASFRPFYWQRFTF